MAVMISRFAGFDKSYEEASLDLGESGLGTFFRVTLPMVWPGIVSSLLLCFLISFDDFVISFFLIGTEKTLPLHIWSQMRLAFKLPEVIALGSCVFVASLVVLTIAERLRRKGVLAKER
jgi:spermidine/putrescine transport system permease protein